MVERNPHPHPHSRQIHRDQEGVEVLLIQEEVEVEVEPLLIQTLVSNLMIPRWSNKALSIVLLD